MVRRGVLSVGVTSVLVPALLVLGTTVPVEARDAQSASIVDLGTTGANATGRATALSARGEIAGLLSQTGNSLPQVHAGIWEQGNWTELGSGEALGVNKHGEVAGFSGEGPRQRATVWSSSGAARVLGNLASGTASQATAINDHGVVAGYSQSFRTTHAVLWDNSQSPRDLTPSATTNSYAYALNNANQVAGAINGEATVWDAAHVAHNLGAGPGSIARAIDAAGHVAGQAGAHAFSWSSDDGLHLLPTPAGVSGSLALGINRAGEIVGNALYTDGFHAVGWHTGAMCDLNTLLPSGSGWRLQSAVGINASGQIAGNGIHDGQEHAYLLTVGRAALDACAGSATSS